MKRNLTLSLIIGLAVATALRVSAQENPEIAPRAVPVNVGPNDVARFLAGMPVPENSSLAPLTRDPAWQEHAAFFEKEFSKLTLRQLQKLHAWQETYFPESLQPIPVAFYMFSGPDFLYVDHARFLRLSQRQRRISGERAREERRQYSRRPDQLHRQSVGQLTNTVLFHHRYF